MNYFQIDKKIYIIIRKQLQVIEFVCLLTEVHQLIDVNKNALMKKVLSISKHFLSNDITLLNDTPLICYYYLVV